MDKKTQQIAQIIKKSKDDPVFFIKNYVKIRHPSKGIIPFKLFPYQEELLRDILKHEQIVINKSRQLGISTLGAAFCLWYCMFKNTKNVLIIATRREVAKNFVDKCRLGYENLPSYFKQLNPLETDNAQSLSFEKTKSLIKAVGTGKDAGRSEALSWLFIDECVSGDSKITIRNKDTSEIREINIEELWEDEYK
jgi:phage terminase large subunit-like protein